MYCIILFSILSSFLFLSGLFSSFLLSFCFICIYLFSFRLFILVFSSCLFSSFLLSSFNILSPLVSCLFSVSLLSFYLSCYLIFVSLSPPIFPFLFLSHYHLFSSHLPFPLILSCLYSHLVFRSTYFLK